MILRLTKILITIFIVNIPNEQVTAQELSKHIASSIDYANIALDLKSIEAQLAIGTQEGNDAAYSIYTKGAYSMPYADITLASPIDTPDIIKKGTEVSGKSSTGNDVTGVVMTDTKKGESVIQVQYSYDADVKLNDQCFVGGIPTPVTDGCFQNEGDLVIGQNSYQYVYDTIADTHNNVTLQSFSSEAESDMVASDGRYFPLFRRYNKYYGRPDYADEWVTAAFSGTTTVLLDGNAKFDDYDGEGKAEAIVNGIAFLNIWMYVFRQMHFAHTKCLEACDGCVDESVEAWDRALALYTGSNTNSPSENGMLMYKVVETMCEVFGTCDNNLNERVLKVFVDSRDNLSSSTCGPIETNIEQIESMMTVPLIQTMLYETYREDRFKDSSKKVEAKGAAAAAALLPRVAFCNSKWADIVYMNTVLGLDVDHTSYEAVKDAIERQYDCLEISCDEVGGIVSPKGGYFDNAEPCGLPKSIETVSKGSEEESPLMSKIQGFFNSDLNGKMIGLISGVVAGMFACIVSLVCVFKRKRKRSSGLETNKTEEDKDREIL